MRRRGFTLIELLIVISVIGILTTIATIAYTTVQRNSRDSVRSTQTNTLDNALEQYYQKNGEYPSARNIVGDKGYSENTATAVAALLGIDQANLTLPGCPSGVNPFISSTTNITTCTVVYEPSSDISNSTCKNATNGGCDAFKLTYAKENGDTVAINSRHSGRPEGAVADAPPAPTVTVVGTSDTTATAQSSAAQCGSSTTPKYSFRYRPSGGAWGNWTIFQTSASYPVTGLVVGNSYGFQAEARCDSGSYVGNISDPSAETIYQLPIPSPTVPTVTRGAETTTTVAFSWPAQQYATSYEYQSRINGGAWSSVQSTTGTSATITSSNGAKIELQARVVNPVGTSDWSAIASGYLLLAAPSVSYTSVTTSTMVFNWTTVSGTLRYESQYRLNGGAWSGTINEGTGTTRTHGPTTQGTRIEVQVRAINQDGNAGAWSAAVGTTLGMSTPAWNAWGRTDNFPNWTTWVYNTGGASLCGGASIYSSFHDGVYGSFWNGWGAFGSNGASSETLHYGSYIASYYTTLQTEIQGYCRNDSSGAQSATISSGVSTTTHAQPNVVLSGPVTAAGTYSGRTQYQLRLQVQETSYNLDADQSNVHWYLYRIRVADLCGTYDQTKTWPWSVSVNGSGWSGSSNSIVFKTNCAIGATEGIASGDVTVTHDSNGNATIGFSGSDGPGSSIFGSASCSGTYGLSKLR